MEEDQGLVFRAWHPAGRALQGRIKAMAGMWPLLAWAGSRLTRSQKWEPQLVHAHFALPVGAAPWQIKFLTGISLCLDAHLGDCRRRPRKDGELTALCSFLFPF
jgi:hypothetical protein